MKQTQPAERCHVSLTGSEPLQVHKRIHMYLLCPLKWHYNLHTFLFCFFLNKVVYYKNILMPIKFISSKIFNSYTVGHGCVIVTKSSPLLDI